MFAGLFRHLTSEMLLLWDRGFFSYELWKQMIARGVKVLARVKSGLILRPIHHLADGSYLAKIYKSDYDRKKDRDGIAVRVIRYTLDDPQRVGHGEEHILITNLFDEDLYPAMELILLYHERWEEEQVFDEQKTHQDPRRATKPAQVRSETPAGVIQEIYALSLGHFVIRSLMFEAAATVNLDPDRLSFTGCFQILKCRLPECDGRTPATFEAWYQGLLWEMQGERTDPRRNRINPRDQAKDVEVEEETPRASASSALDENLSRDSGYNSLNGIALKRLAIRNGVEQGHGTQSNPLGMKDLWPSASRFWKNQARVRNGRQPRS